MRLLGRSEELEISRFKAPEVAKCPGWGFSRAAWSCVRTHQCAGLDPAAGAHLAAGLGFSLIKVLERKGWVAAYQGLSARLFPTSVPAQRLLMARVRSSAPKVPGPSAGLAAGHRPPK